MSKVVTQDDLYSVMNGYEDRLRRLENANYLPRTTSLEFGAAGAAADVRITRSGARVLVIETPSGTASPALGIGGTEYGPPVAGGFGSGTKIRLYNNGSAYALGVDGNTMWLSSDGNFDFYNGTAGTPQKIIQMNSNGIYALTSWLRTYNNTGLYNETWGGGWYMADASWMRVYADKNIYTGGTMHLGGSVRVGSNSGGGSVFLWSQGVLIESWNNRQIDSRIWSENTGGFGYIYAAGYPGTSDRSVKKDIRPIRDEHPDGLLAEVRRVKTYKHGWKASDKLPDGIDMSEHYSVMADELEEIFPDLVTRNFDERDGKEHLAVHYMQLGPILVEAIKELADEVDRLKKKVK